MRALKMSTLILGLALVFGTACKKYEEGPSFSLRSKKSRISNTWTIDKTVYADGSTETATQAEKDAFTAEIKKDGTFTVSYSFGGATSSSSGTWEFGDDKETIKFTQGGTTSTETIILLKNDEWASKDADGDKTYYVAK